MRRSDEAGDVRDVRRARFRGPDGVLDGRRFAGIFRGVVARAFRTRFRRVRFPKDRRRGQDADCVRRLVRVDVRGEAQVPRRRLQRRRVRRELRHHLDPGVYHDEDDALGILALDLAQGNHRHVQPSARARETRRGERRRVDVQTRGGGCLNERSPHEEEDAARAHGSDLVLDQLRESKIRRGGRGERTHEDGASAKVDVLAVIPDAPRTSSSTRGT